MALRDAKMVRPTLGLHLDLPRHICSSILWIKFKRGHLFLRQQINYLIIYYLLLLVI